MINVAMTIGVSDFRKRLPDLYAIRIGCGRLRQKLNNYIGWKDHLDRWIRSGRIFSLVNLRLRSITKEKVKEISRSLHTRTHKHRHTLPLSNAPNRRYHYLEQEMMVSSIVAESGAFHLLQATRLMSPSLSLCWCLIVFSHQGELTACVGQQEGRAL